jgi:hypothetical protein
MSAQPADKAAFDAGHAVFVRDCSVAMCVALADMLAANEAQGARLEAAQGYVREYDTDQARAALNLSRAYVLFGMLEARGLTHELINKRRLLIEGASLSGRRN